MKNMERIIKSQNAKIMSKGNEVEEDPGCNCKQGMTCPLDGKCKTKSIVYLAKVQSENVSTGTKKYHGLCATTFKKRWNGHQSTFRSHDKENQTTLSKYVWRLKNKREDFTINWSIAAKGFTFMPGDQKCGLCTTEKCKIIFDYDKDTLNKRSEIVSKCRHMTKYFLSNLASNEDQESPKPAKRKN